MSLIEVLGNDCDRIPYCISDSWDERLLSDDDSLHKLILLFGLAFRDSLVSKKGATDLIIQWLVERGSGIAPEVVASEMERVYSSDERLSCDNIQRSDLAMRNCERTLCTYPKEGRPSRSWRGITGITIDDVCEVHYIEKGPRKGERVIKFSPDLAAAYIVREFPIISTKDGVIWIYKEGVFTSDGEIEIDQVLDRVAGDLYNIRAGNETKHKIVLRTLHPFNIFDADSDLFCVENGVLNMRTGEFFDHSPEFKLRYKAPVRYDPTAECPNTERFLGQTLATYDNVLSIIDIMAAKTTNHLFQYFISLIGGGSNGKNKLEDWISAFFGSDYVTEVDISTLAMNRFDKIELMNKKFVINSELTGDAKDVRMLKLISGGGTMTADQKNKRQIQFTPRCIIIIDCNTPPRFQDTSYAFQRRLVKIDFPNRFVDNPDSTIRTEFKKDPDIVSKITTPKELSGFLNILLMRSKEVIETRQIHTRTSGDILEEEYDRQSNSMATFVESFLIKSAGYCFREDVYKKYVEYCSKLNTPPKKNRHLKAYIMKHFKLFSDDLGRQLDDFQYKRSYNRLSFEDHSWTEFLEEMTRNLPAKPIDGPDIPDITPLDIKIKEIIRYNIHREENEVELLHNFRETGPDIEKSVEVGDATWSKPKIKFISSADNDSKNEDFKNSGTDVDSSPIQTNSIDEQLKKVNEMQMEWERKFSTPTWELCELCNIPVKPSDAIVYKNGIICSECKTNLGGPGNGRID